MNQGSRLTVMAHFDFFAAMAMGGPPIAISGLKNKCAIPECPQLACDPSGGVRRTPFYTYRCTFWDSDPLIHINNLCAAPRTHARGILDLRRPHRPHRLPDSTSDVAPRYPTFSSGLTARVTPNMQTTCRPRPALTTTIYSLWHNLSNPHTLGGQMGQHLVDNSTRLLDTKGRSVRL